MYCDGSGGDTPTAQTVDASDGAGRRGGLGGIFGGRGSKGGAQPDADEEERAPASNPRPTQGSGQQSGEEKESGGLFSGLGSWWPLGGRVGAEKRSRFLHAPQDLGLREDLHRRFLHGE